MRFPETPVIRADTFSRPGAFLLALAILFASLPALAHHGWAWAEDEQSTLTGKVQSVSMNAPHPTVQVTDDKGATWQIDLGNPNQTERSGFTADSAKAGDEITVLGNRNRDKERNHMKAVRLTIAGKNFDMYPERIRSN
jgi:hypothetical protein